jgi:hypothetical protein
METETREEKNKRLAEISGEKEYGEATGSSVDQLKLKSGRFVQTYISEGKGEDGRYTEATLEDPLKIIILKIRRQMTKFKEKAIATEKPEVEYKSAEYDSKDVPVKVYSSHGDKMLTEATAKKMIPDLKVIIIIYALIVKDGSMVKFTVSGSSLYASDDECEERGILRFYNYLQTFKKGEHTFAIRTTLSVTTESFDDNKTGETREYFAVSFAKSDPLTEKQLDAVGEQMMELAESVEKYDAMIEKKGVNIGPAKMSATSVEPMKNYPNEEVNLDDIPF